MDSYTFKLKLMNLISSSDSSLSPRTTHVLGNTYIPSYQLTANKFPIVTLKLDMTPTYIYGNTTPSLDFGEIYNYNFTCYVFASTLSGSRALADKILDYLKLHNKDSGSGLIDIINLSIQEAPSKHGPRALWRVQINGVLLTEESLS